MTFKEQAKERAEYLVQKYNPVALGTVLGLCSVGIGALLAKVSIAVFLLLI